jgi:hypothetical protein
MFYLLIMFIPLIAKGCDYTSCYETALKKIEKEKSFAVCELGLTSVEQGVFKQLAIAKCGNYDLFGNLELLSKEMPLFLENIGNNQSTIAQQAVAIISTIINNVLKAQNAQTAWVALRAFTPNGLYDVPRWHVDGNYYKPHNFNLPKFAVTLKGDTTLFYDATEMERKDVMAYYADEHRELLATRLNKNQIIQTLQEQGAFFVVGDPLRAAVHSEPPIKQERLFLSMVCGSIEQIAELKNRWGK